MSPIKKNQSLYTSRANNLDALANGDIKFNQSVSLNKNKDQTFNILKINETYSNHLYFLLENQWSILQKQYQNHENCPK